MKGALTGIRVIECATHMFIPSAAAILGDYGADIIKIENPTSGDPDRYYHEIRGLNVQSPQGISYHFEGANRHKRSVTLDLKKEQGKEALYSLVRKSDVFMTSFRRKTLSNLCIDYETLARYNADLIYVSGSGFGTKGSSADDPGYDSAGQSRSGIAMAGRAFGAEPIDIQVIGDQMGAITTAFGVLVALLARERLGIGQEVNTSLLGSLIWLQSISAQLALFSGKQMESLDPRNPPNPLLNFYKAGDGKWFILAMGVESDKYWPTLCSVLNVPELAKDNRFDTAHKRKHNNELAHLLSNIFATKARDEWLKLFRASDLVAQPVYTTLEMIDDPDVAANGYVVGYDHPVLGKVRLLGSPIQLSGTPASQGHAPSHGEHTEEVLETLCGYTQERIRALKNEGVI